MFITAIEWRQYSATENQAVFIKKTPSTENEVEYLWSGMHFNGHTKLSVECVCRVWNSKWTHHEI